MRKHRTTLSLFAAALVAVAALAAAGAAGAATAAATPPTFTVSLLPHALAAGGPATVQGTFTNNGAAVSGVAFTFTFPFAVSVPPANGCASVPFAPKTVVCLVGLVGAGQTASKSFQFTVPSGTTGSVTVNGVAGWISRAKPRAGLLTASDTGTVAPVPEGSILLAANTGCPPSGGTVSSSTQNEGIDTTASTPPSGLDCTPITDGVVTDPGGGSPILFTKLPATPDPVHVTLTFADDNLPSVPDLNYNDPEHEAQLTEYPNYPDLSNPVTVPICNSNEVPQIAAAVTVDASVGDNPQIPEGADSCIVSVNPTEDGDDGGASDVGTIDLLVQSKGNDPGYH